MPPALQIESREPLSLGLREAGLKDRVLHAPEGGWLAVVTLQAEALPRGVQHALRKRRPLYKGGTTVPRAAALGMPHCTRKPSECPHADSLSEGVPRRT